SSWRWLSRFCGPSSSPACARRSPESFRRGSKPQPHRRTGTRRPFRQRDYQINQLMKAIRIHNYGGPEALQYEDAPRPKPQAGEVLVRVHAAGVNPIDWKVREGHMKDFWPHKFPLILGWDVSGTVEELGRGASRFKIGDEVYSLPDPTRDGAYADYSVVRETELALKP